MGSYAKYTRTTTPSFKSEKLWNPLETLEIKNTSPGYRYITCAGYAPTKGRRCRIAIRPRERELIEAALNEIAHLNPHSPAVISRLRTIAGPALCVDYHQYQVESVVEQWQERIKHVKPQGRHLPTGRAESTSTEDAKSDQALKEAQEQIRALREYLAELQGKLQDLGQGQQENQETENQQEEDRDARERERRRGEEWEKEAKRQEDERREREKKEEEERKRMQQQERERAEKEEQERKQRECEQRRAREQAAQNEREHLAREAAQKQRSEWNYSWSQYQTQWTKFLASPSPQQGQSLSTVVPWPVKSGAYGDVKASTVREFYWMAPPRENDQKPNMAKIMRKECIKWHPDRVKVWSGGEERMGIAEMMVVNMISRVVTDLLNEAADRKSDLKD